ncbi:hypothetical protein Tco_1533834 [Tanacetum coccineum]
MDDEPMWAVDHVVALTPGSAITILETPNEFAIKGLSEITQEVLNVAAGGIFLYKTPNQAYQRILEDKGLLKIDWAKNQKTKPSLKTSVALAMKWFSSNSNTNKFIAEWMAMGKTLKMDAQYKELQTHAKKTKLDLDEDDIPMSREEEAKFMKTFFTLEKLYPMDDEPMWAVDHVVAPTPGSAITILETPNEFAIKARMDAMTLKMDAQYKELQTHAKKTKLDLDEDDIPMSREE